MASKYPLVLTTGPNAVKEIQSGDTLAPEAAGITGAYVGTTDTQTLTNKTLTSPRVGTSILDANGAESIDITATGSAVNQLVVTNSATGSAVTISTAGNDASIPINIAPKAGAAVQVNGSDLITASSTTTLSNKTHLNPRLVSTVVNGASTHNSAAGAGVAGGLITNEDGSRGLAILSTGVTDGAYFAIRMQADVNGSSPSILACAPTASNVNILLQPMGTGVVTIRTDTGNFAAVTRRDVTDVDDYHAIALPGGSASTIGYIPGGLVVGGAGQTTEQIAVDQNVVHMFPFIAPHNGTSSVTVTGFSVCTGTVNGVASNLRTAIYSNSSGTTCHPADTGTALVAGSEVVQAIPATNATVVTNAAMSASLTPGSLYWFCFVFEANACVMRCHAPSVPRRHILGSRANTTSGQGFFHVSASAYCTGWVANNTYGAFPSNAAGLSGSLEHMFSTNATAGANIMHLITFGS